MKTGQSIRYSEAFKLEVVSQIESGRYSGAHGASKAYGIKGAETVRAWLRRYGDPQKLPKQIKIMSMKEVDENAQLKKRIKELEKALADSYMKGLLSESYLEVACEDMGVDVDEFKKKHAIAASNNPLKKSKG